MGDLKRWRSYTTFRELGGCEVPFDKVIAELRRLPLDGVLGFLGRVSLRAAGADVLFSDPRVQGEYLNLAIVDDFPALLPGAATMYQPGRVPATGDRHLFIHQRNVAWLAHHAILHCRCDVITAELTPSLVGRCCRLLLIANDFFLDPVVDPNSSLTAGRAFALNVLRLQQFMAFTANAREAVRALAREWLLFSRFLASHFDARPAFANAMGRSLDEYFDVLSLFVPYVFHTMSQREEPWQRRDLLFRELEAARDTAEDVVERWVATPDEYADSQARFSHEHQLDDNLLEHFDYVALQETPLIEARPGDLIIPVLPYLYSKPADEPYFRLAKTNEFRTSYGKAYEDYAHELVKRIAGSATDGPWLVWPNPPQVPGEEFCDSLLIRGRTAIVFEHKGGRLHSGFLRGGDGARVLGPSESTLSALDSGLIVSVAQLKNSDKALLTRGLWQLGSSGADLTRWIEGQTGEQVAAVWPIITHHAPLRVDSVVRHAYLNRLIAAATPFPDSRWQPPQWLQVEDLEALAHLAEQGKLQLGELLEQKCANAEDEGFEQYLRHAFGDFPLDLALDKEAVSLMKRASERFWPGRTSPAPVW